MKKYYKQIDALRFYAVFSVIIYHLYPEQLQHFEFLRSIYSYVPGVPLFFCISGFLISNILSLNFSFNKTKKALLQSFYFRRVIRIFPIYYATVFFLFIVNVESYRDWFIYDLLYITNIKQAIQGSFSGSLAPHFWSLAVEEQFYLFWPFLLTLSKKANYQLAASIVLFLIGCSTSILIEDHFATARTVGCLSYLGSGAALGVIWARFSSVKTFLTKNINWVFITSTIVVAIFIITGVRFSYEVHLLIKIFFIFVLVSKFIIGFKNRVISTLLELRVVIYLGRISYGLYIYHLLVIIPLSGFLFFLPESFKEMYLLIFILKIALTIIISILSWEIVEIKILKLKSKFKY